MTAKTGLRWFVMASAFLLVLGGCQGGGGGGGEEKPQEEPTVDSAASLEFTAYHRSAEATAALQNPATAAVMARFQGDLLAIRDDGWTKQFQITADIDTGNLQTLADIPAIHPSGRIAVRARRTGLSGVSGTAS